MLIFLILIFLMKIVGNSLSNVQIAFILMTYLGLHCLALPVFGSFRYLTLACKDL